MFDSHSGSSSWHGDRFIGAQLSRTLVPESPSKCGSGSRKSRKPIMRSGVCNDAPTHKHAHTHTNTHRLCQCVTQAQRAGWCLKGLSATSLPVHHCPPPSQVLILSSSFWWSRTLGSFYNWSTLALGKVCVSTHELWVVCVCVCVWESVYLWAYIRRGFTKV